MNAKKQKGIFYTLIGMVFTTIGLALMSMNKSP